jgi:copper(I)-binding protein
MSCTLFRGALAAILVSLAAPATLAVAETGGHAPAAEAHAGDLVLSEGFSRATRPGAPVGGGFLTITNDSDTDDRLVAAASDAAGVMQIHEMAMEGGKMRMRELAGGLAIPAHQTVVLKPGGYHIMFMELKHPLVEGDTVDVTLTFEKAGTVTVPLAILAPDATAFEAGHGH